MAHLVQLMSLQEVKIGPLARQQLRLVEEVQAF